MQVMKDFCATHPRDPDCSGRGQSAPLSPFLIGGAVLLLLLSAGARWYILNQGKRPVE